MKTPCMFAVRYILPAIRVLVMKDLLEKHNLEKKEAADKMKLTPAAITQYMKGARGSKLIETIKKSENTMKIISEFASALANDSISEDAIPTKMCEVCMSIRIEGAFPTYERTPRRHTYSE